MQIDPSLFGAADTLEGIPIVGISASPSAGSSTARVLEHILSGLGSRGAKVTHLRVRDLPAADLIAANAEHPSIQEALGHIDAAAGLIIATPIYKAAYSGLLKLFLDLMPQFGLAGKTVLPLATGGSLAHALALDYGLRPVLQSMGPRHIVQSLLVPSSSIIATDQSITLDDSVGIPLQEAVYHLQCSIVGQTSDKLLGHPRPSRGAPI